MMGFPPLNADSGFVVSPIQFGGDPTGHKDSTAALRKAMAECVNASSLNPSRTFPYGIHDGGGCTVDLMGGEYLISGNITVPAFTANVRLESGSLVAASNFPAGQFMVVIGDEGACHTAQGSCTVDISVREMFFDGSRVASGSLQINSVMGTVVQDSYFLNFTSTGIQINGGHEVMISNVWLGEVNFDFNFQKQGATPAATCIEVNSNDHFIEDVICFAYKVGLAMHGAANLIDGMHVWFPFNAADSFDVTAFLVTGGINRFVGCYIDVSQAVIESSAKGTLWQQGFVLGGPGFVLSGPQDDVEISNNVFNGGSIEVVAATPGGPTPQLTDVRVFHNLFQGTKQGKTSRVTQILQLTEATGTQLTHDFGPALISGVIQNVQASVAFTSASNTGQTGTATPLFSPSNTTVSVNVDWTGSGAPTGTVTLTADVSSYSAGCLAC